jgi:hypothetical protein
LKLQGFHAVPDKTAFSRFHSLLTLELSRAAPPQSSILNQKNPTAQRRLERQVMCTCVIKCHSCGREQVRQETNDVEEFLKEEFIGCSTWCDNCNAPTFASVYEGQELKQTYTAMF